MVAWDFHSFSNCLQLVERFTQPFSVRHHRASRRRENLYTYEIRGTREKIRKKIRSKIFTRSQKSDIGLWTRTDRMWFFHTLILRVCWVLFSQKERKYFWVSNLSDWHLVKVNKKNSENFSKKWILLNLRWNRQRLHFQSTISSRAIINSTYQEN